MHAFRYCMILHVHIVALTYLSVWAVQEDTVVSTRTAKRIEVGLEISKKITVECQFAQE